MIDVSNKRPNHIFKPAFYWYFSGAVNALFERVELQHGRVLVRHALAYITAAKSGLTGTEIEDLLSCDDHVLDDVYQYWTPPIRRIPPLLWVRIRGDLAGYLVDRGADGASVITWYHRQFIEAARVRYLSSDEERTFTHQALSNYFLGVWANGRKKPYRTAKGEELEADRFVSHQPWRFEGSTKAKNYNYRKINELPYHLVLCNDTETLKGEVLCNFTFLLTCLESYSLRDLIDEFDFALEKIADKDIQLVKEALQLSTFALLQHPAQLSSQLLGRIQTFGLGSYQGFVETGSKPLATLFVAKFRLLNITRWTVGTLDVRTPETIVRSQC